MSSLSKELDIVDHWTLVDKVATLYVKGNLDATKIARELKITRAEVIKCLDEYREIARNDTELKERARELTYNMDKHFSMIIERLYYNLDMAEAAEDTKTANAILKNIADVEAKRQDTMQKAGMYDDAALGDEMAETQEKVEGIKELLMRVAKEHPQTSTMIREGLSRIFNKPIATDLEVQPRA